MDIQKVKGALVRAYGILGGQMYNVSDIEEALAELDKPASEDARLLVDLWALEHSGKYESAQTANADLAKRIDSYAAKQVASERLRTLEEVYDYLLNGVTPGLSDQTMVDYLDRLIAETKEKSNA